jgi:hypothetical protein
MMNHLQTLPVSRGREHGARPQVVPLPVFVAAGVSVVHVNGIDQVRVSEIADYSTYYQPVVMGDLLDGGIQQPNLDLGLPDLAPGSSTAADPRRR